MSVLAPRAGGFLNSGQCTSRGAVQRGAAMSMARMMLLLTSAPRRVTTVPNPKLPNVDFAAYLFAAAAIMYLLRSIVAGVASATFPSLADMCAVTFDANTVSAACAISTVPKMIRTIVETASALFMNEVAIIVSIGL